MTEKTRKAKKVKRAKRAIRRGWTSGAGKVAGAAKRAKAARRAKRARRGRPVFRTRAARPEAKRPYYVHPTAIVDEGALIGEGTRIWHFCHVMEGARIGRKCNIGQNVFIGSRAVIGDGCKIQNNISIYDAVILEENVFLGPSAALTNVRNPRAHVSRKDAYAMTIIRKGATVGANSTIVCGVEIGPYAFIGAGAVVTKNVAAHALMTGVPARRTGWACECGGILPDRERGGKCPECGKDWGF
jgi:UDP-2-acetamido-3-amino-2,3-dideoxy-glucuronate N-acetyltransferase